MNIFSLITTPHQQKLGFHFPNMIVIIFLFDKEDLCCRASCSRLVIFFFFTSYGSVAYIFQRQRQRKKLRGWNNLGWWLQLTRYINLWDISLSIFNYKFFFHKIQLKKEKRENQTFIWSDTNIGTNVWSKIKLRIEKTIHLGPIVNPNSDQVFDHWWWISFLPRVIKIDEFSLA